MSRRARKWSFAGPSGLTYLWDLTARENMLGHNMLLSHQFRERIFRAPKQCHFQCHFSYVLYDHDVQHSISVHR